MKKKHTRFLCAVLMLCCMVLTACHTDRPDNYLEENLKARLTQSMVEVGLTEEQVASVLTVYDELGGDGDILDNFAYDKETRILTAEYDAFYTLQFAFDESGILHDVICQYFDADDRHHYVFYENQEVVAPFEKWLILGAQRDVIIIVAERELYAYNEELTAIEASQEEFKQWHFDKIPQDEMNSDVENVPDYAYYATAEANFTYADGAQDTGRIYIIIYVVGDEWITHSLQVTSVNAPCNMDGTIIGE